MKQIPVKLKDPLAIEWYENQDIKNLSIEKAIQYVAKRFGTGDFLNKIVNEVASETSQHKYWRERSNGDGDYPDITDQYTITNDDESKKTKEKKQNKTDLSMLSTEQDQD